MRQYESYKCNTCGNVIEVQNVGGGELHCCSEAMDIVQFVNMDKNTNLD